MNVKNERNERKEAQPLGMNVLPLVPGFRGMRQRIRAARLVHAGPSFVVPNGPLRCPR